MNTLNKTITAEFFGSNPESFEALEVKWNEMLKDPKVQLTATDHLLYAVLRGKDYRKGFTPVSNQKKLDNGQTPLQSLNKALAAIHNPYGIYTVHVLASETIARLREVLPKGAESLEAPAYKVTEKVA